MKRLCSLLFSVVMLLAACSKDSTSTSSTANNDNGGSVSNNPLIGMWSQDEVQTTSNAYRDKTYQFIDDETVIYYGRCWNTGGESYGMTKSPLPDHYGWYYFDMNRKLYTYSFYDNKVYIVSQGVIMTLMSDGLYIDGESRPLHRF